MNDREFVVNGKRFQLNKIDALKQFHIVRRLGPILGSIIPVIKKLKVNTAEKKSEAEMLDDITVLAQPLMAGFSDLSDEDANLVLLGLCSAVEMYQDGLNCWARVADGKQFMVQNLELPELLQIAGRAFAYNLTGFFTSAHRTS